MDMVIAGAVLLLAALYGTVGILFAVAFVIVGITRVDHAAIGSPWSFRVLLLPGAAALWPLLLARWAHSPRPTNPAARGHSEVEP